jgi:2-dehydropantoate 2-reductase
MKIVILGAGAIGRLFGVFLARGGHRIVLVDPDQEIVDTLNKQGIGFMEAGGIDPDAVSYVKTTAVNQAADIESCDLVLLAVKSFDTLSAVQAAQHLISRTSPVITLQTGLGNIEQLERVVARDHIIGGFTFMAATSLGSGIVRQGGTGKTYLGELDGRSGKRLQTVCATFNNSGLECSPVHRIIGRLWCKVIVFSAINAVTSILQIKNGQLLDSMESITLLKRLIDEGRKVAETQAIDLVFHDLYELLFAACKRTDQNLSSMLQDILAEKQTEIDAQCGALVKLGEQAGISTPTQQTMLELVQLISKKHHDSAA